MKKHNPTIALWKFLFCLLVFLRHAEVYNPKFASADVYYFGFLPKGLLAALAGLSLGSLSYLFAEKLRQINFKKIVVVLLNLVQIVCFASIFYLVCNPRAHQYWGSFIIVLFFVGISIAFADISITAKLLNNKFVFYLEKLSLPVYLNQMWVMVIVRKLFPDLGYYKFSLVSIVATIVISAIFLLLMSVFTKLCRRKKVAVVGKD